jgi:hypothetical protein
MVSPAAADWVTTSDDGIGTYATAALAEDGRAQFEIACEAGYHDILVVTIFTGEAYDPESSYSDEVPISVITDGGQQPVFYGAFEGYDGELVVTAYTSFDGPPGQFLGAMAASTSTIDVQFYQREYRFSPEGFAPALRYLDETCQ